jgi:hypothetical protein
VSGTSSLTRLSSYPTRRLCDDQVDSVDPRRGDATASAGADPVAGVFASGAALSIYLESNVSLF